MNTRFKFALGAAAVVVALVGQTVTNWNRVHTKTEERDPYAWHMTCEYWEQRSLEILQDENIPLGHRWMLVNHFRTKVEGECKHPKDLQS